MGARPARERAHEPPHPLGLDEVAHEEPTRDPSGALGTQRQPSHVDRVGDDADRLPVRGNGDGGVDERCRLSRHRGESVGPLPQQPVELRAQRITENPRQIGGVLGDHQTGHARQERGDRRARGRPDVAVHDVGIAEHVMRGSHGGFPLPKDHLATAGRRARRHRNPQEPPLRRVGPLGRAVIVLRHVLQMQNCHLGKEPTHGTRRLPHESSPEHIRLVRIPRRDHEQPVGPFGRDLMSTGQPPAGERRHFALLFSDDGSRNRG